MSTIRKTRQAHKMVDDLKDGNILSSRDAEFLRSFLPELPKQKTLEELRHAVYAAWSGTHGNKWLDDVDGDLETWLYELHQQLKGLKDKPAAVPALPAGMRLADHEQYGRVITSPKPNRNGVYDLLVPRPKFETGADWEYAHEDSLTFIAAEPDKSAHPEFLETEADYESAPEGTIVACDDSLPWHKFDSAWLSTAAYEGNNAKNMTGIIRRVLRWGDGE